MQVGGDLAIGRSDDLDAIEHRWRRSLAVE
jgi:hypothetical protein